MRNAQQRGARTPHCGGAHNAPLTPEGEGKGRARTRNFLLRSRNYHTAALAKKILQKDFLRRGAASVSGVLFGKAEQSQMALRRDEPLCEKIRELYPCNSFLQTISAAAGRIFHSASRMTRFCSISGVSPSSTFTAFCKMIGPPSHTSLT